MRLAGKTAFCTASGAGIGRATVEAFAAEGARVIATDISAKALDGAAGRGRDACAGRDGWGGGGGDRGAGGCAGHPVQLRGLRPCGHDPRL